MTLSSAPDLMTFSDAAREAVRRTRAAERTLDQSGVLMWATTIAGGEWRLDPVVVLRGGEVASLSAGVAVGVHVDVLVGPDSGYPRARAKILAGHGEPLGYLEHPRGLSHSSQAWLSRYTPVRDGGGRVIGIACTSMPFSDVESTAVPPAGACPFGAQRPCLQPADREEDPGPVS